MPRRRPALTLAVAGSLSAGAAPPALAVAPASEVRVGQAADFTRIEFRGAQPSAVSRDGQTVTLRFGAAPYIRQLRITPPRLLAKAESVAGAGGTQVRLTLAEGVSAKLGRADGATYLNLTPPPKPEAAKASTPGEATPATAVKLGAALEGRALKLSFPFGAPVGAAVFRRGEAIWVVFDAKAALDLSDAPSGLPQLKVVAPVTNPTVTAVRLLAPAGVQATVRLEGGTWTVTLAAGPPPASAAATVARDDGAVVATVPGAPTVHWLADPAVGDRLAVVTTRMLTPTSGRKMVEAVVLSAAQGLVVQPVVEDLLVTAEGERVRIGRPHGLALSAPVPDEGAHPSTDLAQTSTGDHGEAAGIHAPEAIALAPPKAASAPGLIPFDDWAATNASGFLARYDVLKEAAAAEGGQGAGAPVEARLALARFLVGSELAHEAIGVLNLLLKSDPKLADGPEFRGLRGAARAIAGRWAEAQSDLSTAPVASDPAAALWLAYAQANAHDWPGARAGFAQGRSALAGFNTRWRARFAKAQADTALALGDVDGARAALQAAPGSGVDPLDMQGLTLAQARVAEASGQADQALKLYRSVETSPYGAVSTPAALHSVQLRLAAHAIPMQQALGQLDSLRFRWRGGATELEVVGALSRLYLSQGRYREALDALRSAGRRLPDLPEAEALRAELAQAFRTLFLDGLADGLQPIQAVALFDDFRELTPIGADGDRMVRRLARRLVEVDLLDGAAALLKYQVENRLDGVPKAEVAADLAAVYLMARQPEAALEAINSTRTTLLPGPLNAERRVLEARAMLALGRFDHALELTADDRSPEALEVRADAAWARKSWAEAGALLEARLGDRWRTAGQAAGPVSPEDEQRLLRAGIAYSLAQDDKALARLRARWGRLAQAGTTPDAMRVALSGGDGAALTPADLQRATAGVDAFAGWVARAKARFLAKGGPALRTAKL